MSTTTPPSADSRPRGATQFGDEIFRGLCSAAGVVVIGLALAMVFILTLQAWPVLSHLFGYRVLTSDEWKPDAKPPIFGALAFVYGTLASSAIAMLIAVPIGVGSAAFLAEIAHGWVRRVGSFLVELLAAVPSVVYGFWGIFFLRPVIQWFFDGMGGPNTAGAGILAAGVLLAIMIVPYITAIAFDACRSVPRSQREAALALGATRWQTIRTAVLPYARPAIIAACFLALGRALGETMAVTMVIGNRTQIQFSIFAVGDSMASVIANRLNEADTPQVRSALVTLGLLLLVITSILNVAGRLLIRRVNRRSGKPAAPPAEPGVAPTKEPAERPVEAIEYQLPKTRWSPVINRIMTGVLAACLLAAIVPLFLILFHVVREGLTSINVEFFTETPRPLITGSPGGLKHALVGSAMIVGLTLMMAVPLGVLTAIFLAESRAYRFAATVRFVVEVLGGVPSIVLGIFAYALFVVPPFLNLHEPTFSAWAGAFALAVMMIPVVVRAAEEALRMVPPNLRQASFALGANYWQTVVKVLVPAALPAILTGIILAASRVAGETAPLLLTAGGSNFMPHGPGEPTPFLPKYIYEYSTRPEPEYQRLAWAAALVLLGTVMTLNIVTRVITGKRQVSAARGD
jgi:phosphate transport system permease protein